MTKYPNINRNKVVEVSSKIELTKIGNILQVAMVNECCCIHIPFDEINSLIKGLQFCCKNKSKLD